MKLLYIILFSFNLINAFASDSIVIVQMKEIYSLSETCNDSIIWEEISYKNKEVENIINTTIASTIQSLKHTKLEPDEICNYELIYKASANVVYFNENILSVYFMSHCVWPNFRSETQVRTCNFDIKTGKTITFHELLYPEKIPVIDSLLLNMTIDWYKEYEMDIDSENIIYVKNELKKVNYIITSDAIIIYLHGIHCGYCTDEDPEFRLSYEEYGQYFNKNGVLKGLVK